MLTKPIELYKLELCEITSSPKNDYEVKGELTLMTDDSVGEGFVVHGRVEAVNMDDWFCNAKSFDIERVEELDENGDTIRSLSREELGGIAPRLECHVCGLINEDEVVCETLQEIVKDRDRPCGPCEMTIAKNEREKRDFSMFA